MFGKIEWKDPQLAMFGVGPVINGKRLNVPDIWMPIKGEESTYIRTRLHLPEIATTITSLGLIAAATLYFLK
jgi:hypothetical protein